jgi:hypothetical protein
MKKIFNLKNKYVALATCDKEGNPHNIVVQVSEVNDKEIFITDNYMQKTKENIKNNPKVALVFWEGEEGVKINGTAEYISSGKVLNKVKNLEENKGFPAKGAIVINIEEVKNA